MNTVSKYYLWVLVILGASCVSEPVIETVHIGKTVKIRSEMIPTGSEIATYYWQFNDKPDSSTAMLLVENDKALFTPDRNGSYSLSCSLINSENQIIYQEVFHYIAIESTTQSTFNENIQEVVHVQGQQVDSSQADSNIKTDFPQENVNDTIQPYQFPSQGTGRYSIQISSWKTMKTATQQIKKLESLGINGRIDMVYLSDSDKVWYRVRVGNFSTLSDAGTALKILSPKLGAHLWIDDVKKGN